VNVQLAPMALDVLAERGFIEHEMAMPGSHACVTAAIPQTNRSGDTREGCIGAVSDESTASRIEQLVAEEHEPRAREQADSSDTAALDEDRERLRAVEVEPDRCWDPLRQRRALRDAGGDPDDTQTRDADTVEQYTQ